jgi:hypothetical protein
MQRSRFVNLLVGGIVVAVAGLIGLRLESTNHALCRSAIISALAPGQCGTDDTIYDLAVAALVCGAVLAVVGLILLANARQSPSQPPMQDPLRHGPVASPGWFPSPWRPGYEQWWNGYQWTGEYRASPPSQPPAPSPPPP